MLEPLANSPDMPDEVEAQVTAQGIVLDYTPQAKRAQELKQTIEAIRQKPTVTNTDLRDLLMALIERVEQLERKIAGR